MASSVRSCLALSKPSFHSGARITPGYCWRTSFHATGLRLLLWIPHVPRPSMTAYARHNFRHWGVRQQYPPGLCTGSIYAPLSQAGCRTSHYNNLCFLVSSLISFSTLCTWPSKEGATQVISSWEPAGSRAAPRETT